MNRRTPAAVASTARRRRICVSMMAVAMALAAPTVANAGTISFSGGVLTYTATAGEANNVSLTLGTEDFACTQRGAPCIDLQEAGENATLGAFPAECSDDGGFGSAECEVPNSVVLNLGDGDDSAFDWEGPSTINGGPGNEIVLKGAGGNDVINGGPGNDSLFGGQGNDTLDGGDGNDIFEGFGGLSPTDPLSTMGTDVYAGGAGKDFLDYAGRTEDMSLSIDGAANDGAPGEADRIGLDVEELRGGNAADTITGSAGANSLDGWDGNDALRGGAGEDALFGRSGDDATFGEDGQDTIEGGDGNDAVDGGAGIDTLYGDELQTCIPSDCATGQDTIAARDGANDTVKCGPGEDSAVLDAGDAIPEFGQDICERVDRSAATGAGAPGSTSGGSTGGGGAAADVIAPRLQGLVIGRLRRGRSTTVRYTLSEPATVIFRFERRVRSRWVKVRGTFRHAGRAGANRARFAGRVSGRRLKNGRYRLTAVARDAAGNQGPPARSTFRVTR